MQIANFIGRKIIKSSHGLVTVTDGDMFISVQLMAKK